MQKAILCFLSVVLLGSHVLADVTVINNLSDPQGCPGGNSLTVFANGGQQYIGVGSSAYFSGDFSGMPGLGIQVNNWYWTSSWNQVQGGNPQNPDNCYGKRKIQGR